MQQKAFLKLLGLQYKLIYKKVLDNKETDALSRQEHIEELQAISIVAPKWLKIILEGYRNDP